MESKNQNTEAAELIRCEEEILAQVLHSLSAQAAHTFQRLRVESARARDLTSRIVNSRSDIDKQMLASDEAVAHQLTHSAKSSARDLEKLLDRPYFARIVLEEQAPGGTREIEYKLGFAANTDCRIIDWRKAPIARLYYEYQQGDDYCEIIQGRERTGRIKHRIKLDIRKGELIGITSRGGSFAKLDGAWKTVRTTSGPELSPHDALPDVLSLITPEQFRLITEDSATAVLIQGIAGSGKTTVALHRLAWLLHADNSSLLPKECLVLVVTKALQSYISQSLPQLGVENVPVLTFHEWTARVLSRALGSKEIIRPRTDAPPAVKRVKRSLAMLLGLEEYAERCKQELSEAPLTQCLLSFLAKPDLILKNDDSRLLDREIIALAHSHTQSALERGELDPLDDAALLRLYQLRTGSIVLADGSSGLYRHIVADEAQELSGCELAAVAASVNSPSGLTLVGDTGQEIGQTSSFLGWEKLRNRLSDSEASTAFTSLTVSHRSTLPIMRLADQVSGRRRTTDGRPGKPPLWLSCGDENQGVHEALGWLQRVSARFPNASLAVLCRTAEQARLAAGFLTPTFGSAVRLGDEDHFSFGEGILVSSIDQVKGLEFANVLLWNPDARSFPATMKNRNLLYVAITRCQQNLCLVTWTRPSPLLPPVTSKLVRGIQLGGEEPGKPHLHRPPTRG